jgi:hypothetical protein
MPKNGVLKTVAVSIDGCAETFANAFDFIRAG